jgi:radical SAM enzyme (TIGR01210 family)
VTTASTSAYPDTSLERDRWIIERRGGRESLDPEKPYAFLVEEEPFADGTVGPIATIFLTNHECPWRCAMCDLWRNTLTTSLLPGAIPRQIEYALARLPSARQVKLYNSGSFFDPRAIPTDDYKAIAALLKGFDRVIVECHPSLIGENCFRFLEMLDADFEIAMGLETAHPEVLEKLNKRMTLDDYAAAAESLLSRNIALRSFILVQPPFMRPDESLFWACRSIDFAISCGASVMTLIPTRGGNGAVEQLALNQQFIPPDLSILEDALDYGITQTTTRIFIDLWDIERVEAAACCRAARMHRLRSINLSQNELPRVSCTGCR